jgi:DNA-binding IclR family transcriptional regulator
MRELTLEVSESCHLAVIAGDKLVVVMEELSPARVRISVEVGSSAPVLHTVSGRLLLAYLTDRELHSYLEGLEEYREMGRPRRDALLAELRAIREAGYAVSASSYRTGTDLSVLVGNPGVGVAASLAMPVLAGGVNEGKEKQLLRALRQCARKINEGLRLSGPGSGNREEEKGEVA